MAEQSRVDCIAGCSGDDDHQSDDGSSLGIGSSSDAEGSDAEEHQAREGLIYRQLVFSLEYSTPPASACCEACCLAPAVVRCLGCVLGTGALYCATCDAQQHARAHLHERQRFDLGHFVPLKPSQYLAPDPNGSHCELHAAGA